MRINKFLSSCGLGSRRKVEELIKKDLIFVNGKICNDLSKQISEQDIVEFQNKKLKIENKKITIMLNKPIGYLVTKTDDRGRKTIYDLLPEKYKNLNYIGRLDYNSSGLLILTNDGDLNQKITKPKNKIPKTYEVTTDKKLTSQELKKLEHGVVIEGHKTLPAEILNANEDKFTITIYEGKKRQIRLMVASLNAKVVKLKRIQIGKLKLGNLELGKYKLLEDSSVNLLTKID
ncbi:MAG TPA: pseudouridine synthase [bacterium]|jgi:23S rRNA pseudouridine2605 synthase|nr:pseudouridine synthase [bacterium]HOG38170.1 pseudouridine synthase [bacterium]HQI03390.1 pseudouridine synthase [bacterium]